jgi:hypothetical protein
MFRGSPLHWAAAGGKQNIVNLLLRLGADLEARNNDGRTPLHSAAATGHEPIVAALLAKGADANALDADRNTPLHLAAERGFKRIVEQLLANKANAKAVNKRGESARERAVAEGKADVAAILPVEKDALPPPAPAPLDQPPVVQTPETATITAVNTGNVTLTLLVTGGTEEPLVMRDVPAKDSTTITLKKGRQAFGFGSFGRDGKLAPATAAEIRVRMISKTETWIFGLEQGKWKETVTGGDRSEGRKSVSQPGYSLSEAALAVAQAIPRQRPFDLQPGAPIRITAFCQARRRAIQCADLMIPIGDGVRPPLGNQYLANSVSAGIWALTGIYPQPLRLATNGPPGMGLTFAMEEQLYDGQVFAEGTEIQLGGKDRLRLVWMDQPFEVRKNLLVVARFRNTVEYLLADW